VGISPMSLPIGKGLSWSDGEAGVGAITTTDGTEIFYKDWGSGQPIVFSHGWPLSADDWDTQMLYFLHQGYRVIAHDRRGHGRSTQTGDGHDMDHYADDCVPRARLEVAM
jgi:pimeloyl-ACP methyl ester carboxylesterase